MILLTAVVSAFIAGCGPSAGRAAKEGGVESRGVATVEVAADGEAVPDDLRERGRPTESPASGTGGALANDSARPTVAVPTDTPQTISPQMSSRPVDEPSASASATSAPGSATSGASDSVVTRSTSDARSIAAARSPGTEVPASQLETFQDQSALSQPPATESNGAVTAPGVNVPSAAPEAAGSHVIPGVDHTWQKWNNCGPSSALMAMSAFGLELDQLEIAAELKPDREDTNVTPDEIARFVRSRGLRAVVRLGGTPELARSLVRVGVPVVAEQWIDVDGRGEMGHYRVVTGFDAESDELIAMDSYYGPDRRYSYAAFAEMWRPFLGVYVAVFHPDQEADVQAVLGEDWNESANLARFLSIAEEHEANRTDDAWAQFVTGEARSLAGDHHRAIEAFERAIAIGLPTRAFWYQFGYARALHATGAFERLVQHADETIATMDGENLEEWHFWRARALLSTGDEAGARAGLEDALRFNPHFVAARRALERLVSTGTSGAGG